MRLIAFSLIATACAAFIAQASVAAPPQTKYRVIILSDTGASGNAINDLGLVSGSYTLADNVTRHASLWAFGQLIDLGTLGTSTGLNSKVQWPVKNVLGLISGISLTDSLDPNKEGWSCGAFLSNPNFHACRGFVWD